MLKILFKISWGIGIILTIALLFAVLYIKRRQRKLYGDNLCATWREPTTIQVPIHLFAIPYTEEHRRRNIWYNPLIHDTIIHVETCSHTVHLFTRNDNGNPKLARYFPCYAGIILVESNIRLNDNTENEECYRQPIGPMFQVASKSTTKDVQTLSVVSSHVDFAVPDTIKREYGIDDSELKNEVKTNNDGDYIDAKIRFKIPCVILPDGCSINKYIDLYHYDYHNRSPEIVLPCKYSDDEAYFVYFDPVSGETKYTPFNRKWINAHVEASGYLADISHIIASKMSDGYRIPFTNYYI